MSIRLDCTCLSNPKFLCVKPPFGKPFSISQKMKRKSQVAIVPVWRLHLFCFGLQRLAGKKNSTPNDLSRLQNSSLIPVV